MRFIVQRYSSVPTVDEAQRIEPELSPHDVFNIVDFQNPINNEDLFEPTQRDGLLKHESTYSDIGSDGAIKTTTNNQFLETAELIAKRGRLFAKRQIHRLVYKDGNCNVSTRNISRRKKHFFVDIFTTLVDMKWRYNLLTFALAFVGSWFFFTFLWWAIAAAHGDHLDHFNHTSEDACVSGVFDFPTALLFSIETQHTIGYGTRVIETTCAPAIILLMFQSCFGVLIESLMTGLVFSKLSRPKHRAQTMMFSKSAVICLRDGEYCLLFRVGDMRKSHIIGTSMKALIVKSTVTDGNEDICQYALDLETETNFSDSFVFLVWPVTVVHRIVEGSPLWDLSAEQLIQDRFEIIIILEGTLENTGMTTQFRTSYLPSEILWGHRLFPLLTYEKQNGHYEIDFRKFHEVVPVSSMPDCSAKRYSEQEREASAVAHAEDYPINFTTPRILSHSIQRTSTSILKQLMKRKIRRKTTGDDDTPDSIRRSNQSLSLDKSSKIGDTYKKQFLKRRSISMYENENGRKQNTNGNPRELLGSD